MPDIIAQRAPERAKIDAVVIIKTPVLGGDDEIDKLGRDFCERHPVKATELIVAPKLMQRPSGAIDEQDVGSLHRLRHFPEPWKALDLEILFDPGPNAEGEQDSEECGCADFRMTR